MHACTIVARNYIPQAQVLVDTFRQHHPEGTIAVLVIDDVGSPRPAVEGAEVVLIDEIGLDAADLDRMSSCYDVIEFATGVKPWLLTTLLDRGYDHAVYFDPDIMIRRAIPELEAWCRDDGIVLTPHLTEPLPRDGGLPSEQHLLLSGTYNLGFIGVGDTPEARRMLAWWQERLRLDCVVDVEHGYFVDQRFMDFVPGLFAPRIVKDPTWNVAYWNLATRPLSKDEDGRVLVSGRPLTFVHLSGYSPKAPHLLTKHQGPEPRLLLSEDPVLRELCDEYAERLTKAGFGRANERFVPPFGTRAGVAIDPTVRRLLRQELADERARRDTTLTWGDPSEEGFRAWLADPSPDPDKMPNLSRYLTSLAGRRPDVLDEFPETRFGDVGEFLQWCRDFGRREEGVPDWVIEAAAEPWESRSSRAAEADALVPGVELIGYLTADLGLGETARQFVRGLEKVGVPISTRTYTRTLSRQGTAWTDRPARPGTRHDVVLLNVNADMTPGTVADLGRDYLEGRYVVGVWFWELDTWPREVVERALPFVDEVWVCSKFNARGLRRLTDKPVVVVPHPAHAPARSDVLVPELADDGTFTFLFVFDQLSVMERKNPLDLVEAFCRAFPEPGEARLVIKSVNGKRRLVDEERLRYAVADRPDIFLIERYLSREELDGLMWRCDSYVSLHRSEGFGQTLAETMAIGKPVIATRYAGTRSFMTEQNSLLVPHELVPVEPGNEPYSTVTGARWAQPDVAEAARMMREVFEDADLRERLGTAARRTIARKNSARAFGRVAKARLAEIREEQRQRDVRERLVGAARLVRDRARALSRRPR